MLGTKQETKHLPVSYNLYSRPADHGLTSLWILSLACLRLKVTTPSSLSSTGSRKLPISCHYQNYHLQLLVQHMSHIHGILSDVGPQFISRVWRCFCKTLGASISLTSGYYPQLNGHAERCNQELKTTLRSSPSATHRPGASIWSGSNTPTIHTGLQPQASQLLKPP